MVVVPVDLGQSYRGVAPFPVGEVSSRLSILAVSAPCRYVMRPANMDVLASSDVPTSVDNVVVVSQLPARLRV